MTGTVLIKDGHIFYFSADFYIVSLEMLVKTGRK
jgi:hypothetical protein